MNRIEIRLPQRRWIASGLVLALTLLAAGAWASGWHHRGPHRGEFREKMLNEMLDRAEATDEQRSQITAIFERAHAETAALRDDSRERIHGEVLELLTAETVDRAALDAFLTKQRQEREQALERMTEALVEAANVLTHQQRVTIATAVREHYEKRGERRHRRHED